MTPRRLSWRVGAGACFALATTASAQPSMQLATDRVEALMLGSDHRPLAIHEERLNVTIDGEYATTTMHQTYLNNSAARIEGDYALRPGSGAHVDGFAYWNGEQKIVGEVFEKQAAREVYEQTVARGRDPGLLEEKGEGAFGFKVFPVEPHEAKRVEVRWSKWLERHGQRVHYRAPVTSRDAEIVIELKGPVKNITSSTHRLRAEKYDGGVRLRAAGAVQPGEIDLDYDIDEAAWTPDVYVQPGSAKDEGWFALALAAPKLPADTVTAKDMTIVIDRSGSMQTDEKMEHAKRAAADMVMKLGPKDRVNVISFSDEVDPLFKEPMTVSEDHRQAALDFIHRLHPTGGTDIALALRTAVEDQVKGSENPEVVVFLTDGQSDAAQASAVKTGNVRLFTLGLGRDVNKPLLSRLAAEKRGRFTFIEDASQIETQVDRLASNIAKPLLVDVSVTVDGANATRMYPRTLPDLFAEDELRVSGRLRGRGPVTFTIRGKLGGKDVAYTRKVDLGRIDAAPWTAQLWAASRIDHLLEEIALDGTKAEDKDEVLQLSLAYNFVTPYTAFLAIPEAELGPNHDKMVAMRQQKARIREENSDVAAVDGKASNAPVTAQSLSLSMAAKPDADDEAHLDRHRAKHVAADSDDESGGEDAPTTTGSSESAAQRHGCAGCAMTGPDGASSVLLVGLTLLGLRRRRRTP